jgi:CheY-like chemotaxis protein
VSDVKTSSLLIIEDDPALQTMLSWTLAGEGFDVRVASNGREGLDLLQAGLRPGLILLDYMMPVMCGGEFLSKRKQIPELSSIPVVVFSAMSDPRESQPGIIYLSKPAEIEQLISTISNNYSLPRGAHGHAASHAG